MEKFIHFNIAMLYRRHLVPTKHGDVRKQLPKQKPGSHMKWCLELELRDVILGIEYLRLSSKNNLNFKFGIRFSLKIKRSFSSRHLIKSTKLTNGILNFFLLDDFRAFVQVL